MYMQVSRFSQWCDWRLHFSGLWILCYWHSEGM